MKKSISYFAEATLFLLIFYSCTINSPDSSQIELVSYKSNGCITASKTNGQNAINDEAIVEAGYSDGFLMIYLNFTTLCSAELKDSVQTTENRIEIYLKDTNTEASKCFCPHREEFKFATEAKKQVEIIFNYKAYASTEYSLLADTTIIMN